LSVPRENIWFPDVMAVQKWVRAIIPIKKIKKTTFRKSSAPMISKDDVPQAMLNYNGQVIYLYINKFLLPICR
jgi:hypothetical protein